MSESIGTIQGTTDYCGQEPTGFSIAERSTAPDNKTVGRSSVGEREFSPDTTVSDGTLDACRVLEDVPVLDTAITGSDRQECLQHVASDGHEIVEISTETAIPHVAIAYAAVGSLSRDDFGSVVGAHQTVPSSHSASTLQAAPAANVSSVQEELPCSQDEIVEPCPSNTLSSNVESGNRVIATGAQQLLSVIPGKTARSKGVSAELPCMFPPNTITGPSYSRRFLDPRGQRRTPVPRPHTPPGGENASTTLAHAPYVFSPVTGIGSHGWDPSTTSLTGSESDMMRRDHLPRHQRWSLAEMDVPLRHRFEDVVKEHQLLQSKYHEVCENLQKLLRQSDHLQEAQHELELALRNANAEVSTLQQERDDLSGNYERLKQEMYCYQLKLHQAEQELAEVRPRMMRSPHAHGGSSISLESYEAVRREKDALRAQLHSMQQAFEAVRDELRFYKDQTEIQMKGQMELEDQVIQARQKQHADAHKVQVAYQQLHKCAQDFDLATKRAGALQQELEEKERRHAELLHRLDVVEQDRLRLHRVQDNTAAEYRRVMSERDSILKENERLSEDLSAAQKAVQALSVDRDDLMAKMKGVESVLQVVQTERDDLQAKAATSNSPPSAFYSEATSLNSSDEVGLIIGGAEDARKQLEALKNELEECRRNVDDAQRNRDWALSERERIRSERESFRVMCDQFRKERDDQITRLANTLKESDDLKRQRDRVERELRELKERLSENEFRVAAASHGVEAASPSHSRDSAIDCDMAEWEIETHEVNMSGCLLEDDLGLELRGGRDDPILGTYLPVYVKAVARNSKFDNVLRVFDCLMQVNNIDVANMERRSVLDILRNSTQCKMVIKRRRLVGMKLISVPFDLTDSDDPGLAFEDGVYVSKIKLSSPAAKAGNVAIGDRIVYVNDVLVQGRTASEIQDLVHSYSGSGLVLAIMKSPPVMSPMTPTLAFPGLSQSTSTHSAMEAARRLVEGATGVKPTPVVQMDQAVQVEVLPTQPPVTVAVLPREREPSGAPQHSKSLLDKFHDKLFGKSDKKATVKAEATISDDSFDGFRRHGSGRGWSTRSRPSGGRRPTSDLFSGYHIASSDGAHGTPVLRHRDAIPEQAEQLLQDFDHMLQQEDATLTPAQADVAKKLAGSGGTWPKYRIHPNGEPHTISSGGNANAHAANRQRRRENVLTLFSPVPEKVEAPASADVAVQRNVGNPVVIRPVARHEPRPQSYHPAMQHFAVTAQRSFPASADSRVAGDSAAYSSPLALERHAAIGMSAQVAHVADTGHEHLRSPHSVSAMMRQSGIERPRSAQSYGQVVPVYENYEEIDRALQQPHPGAKSSVVVTKPHTALVKAHRLPAPLPASSAGLAGCSASSSSYSSPARSHGNSFYSAAAAGGTPVLGAPYYSRLSPSPEEAQAPPPYPGASAILSKSSRGSLSSVSSSMSVGSSRQGGYAYRPGCEPRTVRIEKDPSSSHEKLGIGIRANRHGVFVSSVSEQSLACRHGIVVGDQLIEVSGINMRNAAEPVARQLLTTVIRSGDPISLVVQHNAEKYTDLDAGLASVSSTPRATPNSFSKTYATYDSPTGANYSHEVLLPTRLVEEAEPRRVSFKLPADYGFTLLGGNAIGIFVDAVRLTGPAAGPEGLQVGDKILECNGVSFQRMTLEQALMEVQRHVDSSPEFFVQYDIENYERSKRGVGDLLYVQAKEDRQVDNSDELSFKCGDILRIDNTAFNGTPGVWRAWLVDDEGRERLCGIVRTRANRLEEDGLKRSFSEMSAGEAGSNDGGSRRGTLRRSFKFMRRSSRSTSSAHQRTPSKDSDTGPIPDVVDDVAFQRVERLDHKRKRPVLILAHPLLVDLVADRLVQDYPHIFARCVPEVLREVSTTSLDVLVKSGRYIDYRRRDKLFEATSLHTVHDIMQKGVHCILDVSPAVVERLHAFHVYPVVMFVKFKNAKHIKELKEGSISGKVAKEMFEFATRAEADFGNCRFFTLSMNADTVLFKQLFS